MHLWNRTCKLICIFLTMVIIQGGCSVPPASSEKEVIFTASGAVITHVTSSIEAVRVVESDKEITTSVQKRMDSLCLTFDWDAGREYLFSIEDEEISAIAPQQPAMALVGSVALGEDLLSLKAGSQDRSASSVAISPEGTLAAVGINDGEIILISLQEGRILDRRKRPGSYIRSLTFVDEKRLAVGEQAPEGSIILYAVGDGRLNEDWKFASGEVVGKGTYDESDPFSWAHQPGIYRLSVSGGGAIFAVATYSPIVDGRRQARWAMFKLDGGSGNPVWIHKSDEETAGVATWYAVDDAEKTIALCVGKDDGEGALFLLDAGSGELRAEVDVPQIEPGITHVSFWRGIALSPDGETTYAITNDGRALIRDSNEELEIIELGEPIMAGDYPVLISGVGVVAGEQGAYFVTGTTFIPWELSSGETVPQPHPSANTVFHIGKSGSVLWQLPIPNLCQGFALAEDEGWLFASYAANPMYTPDNSAGITTIQLGAQQGVAAAAYSVAGTVSNGSPVIDSTNRFILVVEGKRRSPDGEMIEGKVALHVLYW